MTEVVFCVPAHHAFVFSGLDVEVIVFEIIEGLHSSPIGLEVQLDREWFLTHYLAKATRCIPLCLLLIAVAKQLSIRCEHHAVLVDGGAASEILDHILPSLFFTLHSLLDLNLPS